MMIEVRPDATASSITYWMIGLSTRGSISLGCAFVAGRNRVPSPAAGNTAFRIFWWGFIGGMLSRRPGGAPASHRAILLGHARPEVRRGGQGGHPRHAREPRAVARGRAG